MADITMCKGEGCPMQTVCYRVYAIRSPFQSFFQEEPYTINIHGIITCDFFLDKRNYFLKEEIL